MIRAVRNYISGPITADDWITHASSHRLTDGCLLINARNQKCRCQYHALHRNSPFRDATHKQPHDFLSSIIQIATKKSHL